MSAPQTEIKSLAARFLQLIASLDPDRPMVNSSDIEAPYADALKALAYLDAGGFVVGHVHWSNGNAEGVIAITGVRLTPRGKDWLARLNETQT